MSAPEPVPPTREFLAVEVLHGLHLRVLARGADGGVAAGTAEIVELQRVELRALPAEQRLERDAAVDHADHGAVLGRGVVEPVDDQEPAGARHVLHGTMVGLPGM